MRLNTEFLDRCIQTLAEALRELATRDLEDLMHDMMRAACVKQFELILEQSNALLRKRLRPFFASNREIDRLTFKDVYRHSARRGLMSVEEGERWMRYRDIRNQTAHEYGKAYAERAVQALPAFLEDAKALAAVLAEPFDD